MYTNRRDSIKATVRKNSMGGTFQAELQPVDVLTVDDIAERWAAYSGQAPGIAKSHITGFESFILDLLGKGTLGMSETLIVALLAGGLLGMIRHNGGIDWLMEKIGALVRGARGCADLLLKACTLLRVS